MPGTECLPTAAPTCCPHPKQEQLSEDIYPIYPCKNPGFYLTRPSPQDMHSDIFEGFFVASVGSH